MTQACLSGPIKTGPLQVILKITSMDLLPTSAFSEAASPDHISTAGIAKISQLHVQEDGGAEALIIKCKFIYILAK